MTITWKVLSVLLLMCLSVPTYAQDVSDAHNADFEKKLELAEEMHRLKPAADQVNAAIEAAAQRLSPSSRDTFRQAMRRALNFRAIEKMSIDAMIETFTIEELEAMVEYNRKPEAQSITEKFPDYEALVTPQIMIMLDKAMMRYRTGSAPQ